jgi:2-oxoglutarate-dependent dioxygenase
MELTDSEVGFYQREGYLPLPGFVEQGMVAELRAEVFDVLQANGFPRWALAHATSSADKLRQCSQYLAGSNLDSLINGADTLAVASRLIGGPAMRYLPFTAVKAGNGGGVMGFHQDNNYTRHDPAIGSINIWVALGDMAPENGCLQIVPRSHAGQRDSRRSDDNDSHRQVDVDPLSALPIRMRAGYALQYSRDDVKWLDPDTGLGIATCHMHQCTAAAEVEVDTETGQVRIPRLRVASYAGKVINPTLASLQMEGNVAFGVGQSLLEEMVYDGGLLSNPNLSDYMIPSFKDMPDHYDSALLEHPAGLAEPHGLGEGTTAPVPAAIGNAIFDAVGVRIYDLPITPEKILRGMREKSSGV